MSDDHRHANDSGSTRILNGLRGVQFGQRQCQRQWLSLAAAAAAAAAVSRGNHELDRIFSHNDAVTR